MSKISVFVTGSTKGSHDQVKEKFNRVANELKEQGYKVKLPTVIGEPSNILGRFYTFRYIQSDDVQQTTPDA